MKFHFIPPHAVGCAYAVVEECTDGSMETVVSIVDGKQVVRLGAGEFDHILKEFQKIKEMM